MPLAGVFLLRDTRSLFRRFAELGWAMLMATNAEEGGRVRETRREGTRRVVSAPPTHLRGSRIIYEDG